MANTFNDVRRC